MNTILDALREYLGNPDFYVKFGSSTNYTWDYGAMLEYAIGGILLIVVVSSVFKILRSWLA